MYQWIDLLKTLCERNSMVRKRKLTQDETRQRPFKSGIPLSDACENRTMVNRFLQLYKSNSTHYKRWIEEIGNSRCSSQRSAFD